MNDNRISLRVAPEMTPVRLEDRVDVNAEIRVAVDSHLTGLGVVGLVLIFAGIVGLAIGLLTLSFGFLDRWLVSTADPVAYAASRAFVKTVVGFTSLGIVFLCFGTSCFFYGRTVLGSGHLDRFRLEGPTEVEA